MLEENLIYCAGDEQRGEYDPSKANSLDVSNRAIELKTDIEKVREQIQNLE